jgi:hypothetical protein
MIQNSGGFCSRAHKELKIGWKSLVGWGATIKIRGTPFDSSLGIAVGGGLKGTFLDPPGHPLQYSVGGQFIYIQADNQGGDGEVV